MRRAFSTVCFYCMGLLVLPCLLALSLMGRLRRRRVIGLGPHPLINNLYHQRALELKGWEAVTFVTHTYYITSKFQKNFEKTALPRRVGRAAASFHCFCWVVFNCQSIYIYFNGGPLGVFPLLKRVEPFLYKLAGIKVVAMPYGGDIQDLTRSPNLLFKHAMAEDYPGFRHIRGNVSSQIDRWTQLADAVIGGVEWVHYMYYWSDLSVGHFSIDLEQMKGVLDGKGDSVRVDGGFDKENPLKVLHAPNHRTIKGTHFFIDAVDKLKEEGVPIELVLVEGVPNEEFLKLVADCDVLADQLVIGWYAMFAIEGMAMEKPVICYIREDLEQFYKDAGVLDAEGVPFINASPSTIEDTLRQLASQTRDEVRSYGERGRRFVEKYHSLEVAGEFFEEINTRIGLEK